MRNFVALMLAVILLCTSLPALAGGEYTDRETVKRVQQALNEAGFDCGAPDGVAGKKTAAAIEGYRAANGLGEGGEIDAALLQSMGCTSGSRIN